MSDNEIWADPSKELRLEEVVSASQIYADYVARSRKYVEDTFRVRDLISGDRITGAVYLGKTTHPLWPHLCLVIWRMDTDQGGGRIVLDALSPDQVLTGKLDRPSEHERARAIRAALLDQL